MPVAKCPARLPVRWIEALEHNQKITSCCRHPENHEISAWFSSERDRDLGVPDIYIFHCPCGRDHRRFCVGRTSKNPDTGEVVALETRPFWEVR